MLIGLIGAKGAGKDTAADALVDKGFHNLKMAGPLKAMLRAYYRELGLAGWLIERKIDGDLKEVPCVHLNNKTPRYAMQTLGTEWGRNLIGDNLWLDAFTSRADNYTNVVCSDVRFLNEADRINSMGGKLIRIERDTEENEFSAHQSEQEMNAIKPVATIENYGTVEDLHRSVTLIADEFSVGERLI